MMYRMIIGGYAQGKLEYARKKYGEHAVVFDETCDLTAENIPEGCECLIVNHLHLIVKKMISEDITADFVPAITSIVTDHMASLACKVEDFVVISDEIGNGVVPMQQQDAVWREAVGRILTELAKKAESVERIYCGLSTKIK